VGAVEANNNIAAVSVRGKLSRRAKMGAGRFGFDLNLSERKSRKMHNLFVMYCTRVKLRSRRVGRPQSYRNSNRLFPLINRRCTY
jgi:hypothetical protein